MTNFLQRGYSKVFNDNTPVRAGLVSMAAVFAIGAGGAHYLLHDSPSTDVPDAAIAAEQRQILKAQFENLKVMESGFRRLTQEKVQAGESVPQEEVAKLTDAHTAFTRNVLLNREISEQDFADLQADYAKAFGNTYTATYKFQYSTQRLDREETLSFGSMTDAASFRSCQADYLNALKLTNLEQTTGAIGYCTSTANAANSFQFVLTLGVGVLALMAAFNTVTLREIGEDWKREAAAEKRERDAELARKRAEEMRERPKL